MTMTAGGLVKLIEECGELTQICAKKLAYYHTDTHPDDKGQMSGRIEDEIADVYAAAAFVMEKFKLNENRVIKRADEKLAKLKEWDADPTNQREGYRTPQNFIDCEACGFSHPAGMACPV